MPGILSKRALIDKANSTVVAVAAVATFVTIFSLVSTKALISQASYQNKVASAKKTALKQLKTNLSAANNLKDSYQTFDGAATNLLGGSHDGTGDKDGSNSKIVLDSLPSNYDFPALATSLEKIMGGRGLKITAITGSDDELAQQTNVASDTPVAVAMPFSVAVTGPYAGVQQLVGDFQNSIRPFSAQTINLSGSDSTMIMTLTSQTDYQPGKTVKIGSKVVK